MFGLVKVIALAELLVRDSLPATQLNQQMILSKGGYWDFRLGYLLKNKISSRGA
jgi:hypothetical protein